MQENIPLLLQQIKNLSCPKSQYIFAIKDKPLAYDTGRKLFNQAILRWQKAHPEYASRKYTFYTIRSSALCNAYKYSAEKLDTVRHLARHTQGSKTTAKSYLVKDKTLKWTQS